MENKLQLMSTFFVDKANKKGKIEIVVLKIPLFKISIIIITKGKQNFQMAKTNGKDDRRMTETN